MNTQENKLFRAEVSRILLTLIKFPFLVHFEAVNSWLIFSGIMFERKQKSSNFVLRNLL